MSYPILNLAKLTMSIAALSFCSASAFAMTALDDAELSEKSGQALLNLSTIMPGEQGNVNGNTGFYKVGLQAQLDLNANIRKFQLGCGGINGADGCDVDIDYLRFAGLGSLDGNGKPVNNGGALTDFELVNPYIELAMDNPDSLVNRKLVGIRVGGEQTRGVLSIGTRPLNADGTAQGSPVTIDGSTQEDASRHTGINSLSGSIGQLIVEGTADIDLTVIATFPAEGDIQGFDDGDADTVLAFDEIFSSRASQLRLAPLEVANTTFLNLELTADYITDLRVIHNLRIANGNNFAEGFYISLSNLGDNIVDVKKNCVTASVGGNCGIIRQAGDPVSSDDVFTDANGNYIGNKPRDSSSWLKWSTTVNTNLDAANPGADNFVQAWVPAQRGWSLRVPRVEILDFTTSKVDADLSALNLAIVNTPDLKQVPIDNCFGGLSFC